MFFTRATIVRLLIGVKRILILCESNTSLPAQRIVELSNNASMNKS